MTRDENRARLVEEARKHLGVPYFYGAKPEEAPKRFDCSSFVQYVFRVASGIELPRTALEQAEHGRRINARRGLLPGDLIFIRGRVGRYNRKFPQGIGHVILVTGPNEVIHAKYKKVKGKDGGAVIRQSLASVLWRKDITVIKRVI
jgi:cell wall-associated NlpC family hydrolase